MTQQAADLLAAGVSVYLGSEIGKRIVTESNGKIGEIQQCSQRWRDVSARVLKQAGKLIQIVRPGKGNTENAQPCLQGLFDRLLDMKPENLCREDLFVSHAAQRLAVLLGHGQEIFSLFTIAHTRVALPEPPAR